jgi:ABC-type multidrug transport system permease subunit
MAEENNNKKEIQVKSFNHKWYGFLITYGIFNIYFFLCNNSIINNIYKNFSQLYTKEVTIDGADFSIFMNLFAMPIFIFLLIANIGIAVLFEFIAILLFKVVYLKSMVKDEDKVRLLKYIKTALLCFILANIIGIIFYGDIYRTIFYIFLYFPIPLFTFIFICSKMKRDMKEVNSYTADI